MHVIATAGHVDHGKSTLVRALTGMEPDRWAEERRRGLTIDLGYAWTTLDSGEHLAFVDVPGHQRFIGNMLAGLGPAPAVMFVVAADEGWRRQSTEHLAAIDALGLTHGLLVVTRCDLADPGPTMAVARGQLAVSTLGEVQAVAVSGTTGAGLSTLRVALSELVHHLPATDPHGRMRLWVDRAFTIRGSGTVVTGTLGSGTVTVGDTVEVRGRKVRVRGLQCLGVAQESVSGVSRVAVNLRGLPLDEVSRGDTVLSPQAWRLTSGIDARLRAAWSEDHRDTPAPNHAASIDATTLPSDLVLHVGSAALAVHLRPLGEDAVRIMLPRPLPLQPGDRAILRDPGQQRVVAGVLVLDADPPQLRRRGAARLRADALATAHGDIDVAVEVARRGAMLTSELEALGIPAEQLVTVPPSLLRIQDWWASRATWQAWQRELGQAVDARVAEDPLHPALTQEAARQLLDLPDVRLVHELAAAAGLVHSAGEVCRPGVQAAFGPAEAGLRWLEQRLAADTFAAPERPELDAHGLGPRELGAAARAGRLLRLGGDVVLLPSSPALAMRVLATLSQPFTTSSARQALSTTRRVAIPLLEHLDGRGWTHRLDGGHREVVATVPHPRR